MLDVYVGGFLIIFVALCVGLVIKNLTSRKKLSTVVVNDVKTPLYSIQNETTRKWIETTPSRKKRSELRAKRKK